MQHTRSAVNQLSDLLILVQVRQEFTRPLVIANLGELEGNSTAAIPSSRDLGHGVLDNIAQSTVRLAGRLTIRNSDHQHGLVEAVGTSRAHDHGIDDLVLQAGTQRGQSSETHAGDQHVDICRTANAISALHVVHESHRDSILVEGRGGSGHDTQDLSQLVLPDSLLFELDGSTVVYVENHIEQGQLHHIRGHLHGNGPFVGQLGKLCGCIIGKRLNELVQSLRRVEALKFLLLDCANQQLAISVDLLRGDGSSLWRRGTTGRAILSTRWSWRRSGTGLSTGVRRALGRVRGRLALFSRQHTFGSLSFGRTPSNTKHDKRIYGFNVHRAVAVLGRAAAVRDTEPVVQGMGTETAVQSRAIVKIRRADPEVAAGEDVHNPAEKMRGKAAAAAEGRCRAQYPAGEYCRTGRVEQVSRRTEDSPGCSRDQTWFQKFSLTLVGEPRKPVEG